MRKRITRRYRSLPSATIELQLLAAAGMAAAGRRQRVRELVLRGDVDWQELVPLARRHGMMPLLCQALEPMRDDVPLDQLRILDEQGRASAQHSLFMAGELLRLLALLEQNGIPAVPYKGPLLAVLLYGRVDLRQFGDLDVLVRRHDALMAKAVLEGAEYRFESLAASPPLEAYLRFQHHFSFVRNDGQVHLELHYDVRERYFTVPLDLEAVWQRLGRVQLFGREVACFAPEDQLLILCVHGASHAWERLVWIVDIATLIRVTPGLCWAQVFETAERMRSVRVVLVGLWLAQRVLGAPLPLDVLQRMNGARALQALGAGIVRDLSAPTERAGLARRVMVHLVMREDWRDRARYAIRLLVTPTEGDWAWLRLPLASLYYLARPLRFVALLLRRLR